VKEGERERGKKEKERGGKEKREKSS